MKQAIVARTDIGMGTGKLAAQVAHASLQAYEKTDQSVQAEWKAGGQKKVVLKGADAAELQDLAEQARRAGLPFALIRDAGHTQLEPGTITALAVGPGAAAAIDKVTGDLNLY